MIERKMRFCYAFSIEGNPECICSIFLHHCKTTGIWIKKAFKPLKLLESSIEDRKGGKQISLPAPRAALHVEADR